MSVNRYDIVNDSKLKEHNTKGVRFPACAAQVTYAEFKSDFVPLSDYRRGTSDSDVIPSEWDGVSFDAEFGIGGPDMDTMRELIGALNDNARIVLLGDVERLTCDGDISEQDRHLIGYEIEQRTSKSDADRGIVTYGIKDGIPVAMGFVPYVELSMPTPSVTGDDKGIDVYADYYDGGIMSGSQYVPSMSVRFGVHKVRVSSDERKTERAYVQWTYSVYVHSARAQEAARYVTLPKDATLKTGYLALQNGVLRSLDAIREKVTSQAKASTC